MGKKRFKAQIIENKPCCGKCGAILGHMIDYNGVIANDYKSYTRFIRRCSDNDCKAISIYYTDISLEKTVRVTFDESEVTILKEK